MREARAQGTVGAIDGRPRLIPDSRDAFASQLTELIGERVTMLVFVGNSKKARGFYRREVLPKIAEQIGQDEALTHECLKRQFNPIEVPWVDTETGEVKTYTIGGSFEDLGRAGFAKVLEKIVHWGRDFLGANIEEPTRKEQQALLGKD